jgi:hypothetical protein
MNQTKRPNSRFIDLASARIDQVPFAELAASCASVDCEDKEEAYSLLAEAFAKQYTLKSRSKWLPSAMKHAFSKWQPQREEGTNKWSPRETLKHGVGNDLWIRGIYYFIMYCKRSAYIDLQYKDPGSTYCSLVPFILSAFKTYHQIPYSAWSSKGLRLIVEPQLYEAITCEVPEVSSEELLAIRDEGLITLSGATKGTVKNPITTYKLSGIKGTIIGDLPVLTQVMLTQIWCAHPSNRKDVMILDPRNWDEMPMPLISTEVFEKKVSVEVPKVNTKYVDPWDLPD